MVLLFCLEDWVSRLYSTYMCRHERGSQPSRGVLEGLPCFHHNYTQTVWQCAQSNWLYEVTFIFTSLYMGRILTRYKSSCLQSPFLFFSFASSSMISSESPVLLLRIHSRKFFALAVLTVWLNTGKRSFQNIYRATVWVYARADC